MNKPTGKLRDLIIFCSDNIKGLSRKNDLQKYIPLEFENFSIQEENNKLVCKQNEQIIKNIWEDTNCYSNLEILKVIAQIYGIELENEEILDLIKFKNKILLILL